MNQTTYPSVINRACAMLLEGDSFTNMPDGYIRIVMRIIKKINIAKPHAAIFASRARLASESGKSICSVHRAVKWLEDFGFIQRQQTARPELRGSSSPLIPTEKMLAALQLLGHHQPSAATPKGSTDSITAPPNLAHTNPAASSPQTQGSELDCIADSSKSMNLKNDNHSENIRKPEAFVRLQKVKIPHELAWLVEQQQLRATGVLSLMKLAKHAKQRLSDVVAATSNYLKPHKGRALYAYLRTLLGKDKDYRQQVDAEAKQQATKREQEYLERKAMELTGRRFQTRDGQIILTILAQGFIEEIRQGVRRMGRLNSNVLEAISAGRLIAV